MNVNPKNISQLIDTLSQNELVLYGGGGLGEKIAKWLDCYNIDYVIADRNSEALGAVQKLVVHPDKLKECYPNANIIIASIVYYDEIFEFLTDIGFSPQQLLSYRLFVPDNPDWFFLEKNTVWGMNKERVHIIAEMIPENTKSVADYGAGKCTLKDFLSEKIDYLPIDYTPRSDDTIICDFNKNAFPDISTDVCVCTAVLVFVSRADELLRHIASHTNDVIILSYVTSDVFSNIDGRRASGYVNDFTECQIIDILAELDFELKEKKQDPANKIDWIYLFNKQKGKK